MINFVGVPKLLNGQLWILSCKYVYLPEQAPELIKQLNPDAGH